jgi:hypothetical protein
VSVVKRKQPAKRRADKCGERRNERRTEEENMKSHSQELARIKEQLADQSAEWRDFCRVLEGFDPRSLVPVSDRLLEEIDSVCSTRVAVGSAVPVCGVRV